MSGEKPEGLSEIYSLATTFNHHSMALGLKPFEYNPVYHFYRVYVDNEQLIIHLYERLKDGVQLPQSWNFYMDGNYLNIERGSRCKEGYTQRLANTPMNAPFHLHELFRILCREYEAFDCSMNTLLKSHVMHTFHSVIVDSCRRAMKERLTDHGYSLEVLSKGRGGGTEYLMIFTHISETADLAREHLLKEGYKPSKR